MASSPTENAQQRLASEKNIWIASVKAGGGAHLVPVWFAWHNGRIYVCIEPESVKARNMRQEPKVSLALEDGTNSVVCAGTAAVAPDPWPDEVCAIFQRKYEWDIRAETQYTQLT